MLLIIKLAFRMAMHRAFRVEPGFHLEVSNFNLHYCFWGPKGIKLLIYSKFYS